MATVQGQNVIRCQLCSDPVEHHCNLCRIDLCLSCVPTHMTDKSKKHEIVEYTSRKKETVVLPTCLTHKKNRCETYCKDCKLPICIQCLMGSHKKHEFTDILDTLEKMRKQIISDTNELQNTIVPKYQNINPTLKFDQVLSAIEEQEDKICKAVYEASIKLKDKISEEKDEAEKMSRESLSLADKAKKEIMQIIQRNKNIIRSKDSTAIVNYKSKNKEFQEGPKLPEIYCPQFRPGWIKQDQLVLMMGVLKTDDDLKENPGPFTRRPLGYFGEDMLASGYLDFNDEFLDLDSKSLKKKRKNKFFRF